MPCCVDRDSSDSNIDIHKTLIQNNSLSAEMPSLYKQWEEIIHSILVSVAGARKKTRAVMSFKKELN